MCHHHYWYLILVYNTKYKKYIDQFYYIPFDNDKTPKNLYYTGLVITQLTIASFVLSPS